MKPAGFLLVLLLPLLSYAEDLDLPADFQPDPKRPDIPLSFSAVRKYYDALDAIRATYRSRLAAALQYADGAEVYVLTFTPLADEVPEGREADYFPIKPYKQHSRIIRRKRLDGDELARCRQTTIELLKDNSGGGAFCHFPIYGVRLYRAEDVIFETSLGWECGNYYVQYPREFETASWVGYGEHGLWDFLSTALPIPQGEKDRFARKVEAFKEIFERERQRNFRPTNGFVPDGGTAIQIALAVWTPIFSRRQLEKQKPFTATLTNGVWMVTGHLPEGMVGGVAEAEISKKDGRILRVGHGE